MPFIFDETSIEIPDDGSDPPPPRADQFIYFKTADWGAGPDPVHFTVPALDTPRPKTQHRSAKPDREQAAAEATGPNEPRGFFARLLGGLAILRPPPRPPRATGWFRPEEARRRRDMMMALLVPALQEMGARQLYCRYDGGNDEGFAWLDYVQLADGTRIELAGVIERLMARGVDKELAAEGLLATNARYPIEAQFGNAISGWLVSEWAALLLGGGYGTGEYQLYGAFTVDLESLTITDDPEAKAIVENITLADGDK